MRGQHFIKFLRKSLRKERFRGLYYTNKRKGIFSIAWAHRSRKGREIEYGDAIYRAWREESGSDKSNKPNSYLKAQFRSALNHHIKSSKSIKPITDKAKSEKSKNQKLYQFTDESNVQTST